MPWKRILKEISEKKDSAVRDKYISLITKMYEKFEPDVVENFGGKEETYEMIEFVYRQHVNFVHESDPTDGKYAEHFYRIFKNELKKRLPTATKITKEVPKIFDELTDREFRNELKRYEKIRQKKFPKDIEEFSDFSAFETVKDFKNFVKTKDYQSFLFRNDVEGGIKKLVENDTYIVYNILNHVASCAVGSKTDWCTSVDSDDSFNDYINQGSLLLFVNKKVSGKVGEDEKYNDPNKALLLFLPETSAGSLSFKNAFNEEVRMRSIIKGNEDIFKVVVQSVKMSSTEKVHLLFYIYEHNISAIEKYLSENEVKHLIPYLNHFINKKLKNSSIDLISDGTFEIIFKYEKFSIQDLDFNNPFSIYKFYKMYQDELVHREMISVYAQITRKFMDFIYQSEKIYDDISNYLNDIFGDSDIENYIFKFIKHYGDLQLFDIMEDNAEKTDFAIDEPDDLKRVSYKSLLEYFLEIDESLYDIIMVEAVLKPYILTLATYEEHKEKQVVKNFHNFDLEIHNIFFDPTANRMILKGKTDLIKFSEFLLNTITVEESGDLTQYFSDILEDAYNESENKEIFDMGIYFSRLTDSMKQKVNMNMIKRHLYVK